MPIRLTCPSCSATLSVKDEYAGRAVKCPKCGGVIPATAPPPAADASPPAPPTAPAAAPADDFDDAPKPAKTGGKIVGKPVAASKAADDADDEPPRRKGRDGDRGPKSERDDRDDDRDRPARRRRRDADDDGPPDRDPKPAGKSNAPVILAVIGFFLLSCCGGVGYAGWWAYNKAKEVKDTLVENFEKSNGRVNPFNYADLKVGTTTRLQADQKLGNGKVATEEDLRAAFGADQKKIDAWGPKLNEGRAIVWRNNDDFLLAAFHPSADAAGRLQAKEWRPKSGASMSEGELDDAKFQAKYPPGARGGDLGGPAIEVTAEDLAKEYKGDEPLADAAYKDRVVLVDGKLTAIDVLLNGDLYVRLIGVGVGGAPGGMQVRCAVPAAEAGKVFNCSLGQTITFRGRCAGKAAIFVDVTACKFESAGPDPSVTVTAAELVRAYAADEAADERFKGKPITLTGATVESRTGNALILVAPGKGKLALKIKVTFSNEFIKVFEKLKPGDPVRKLKGEGGGSSDGTVYLNSAWLAP